MNINLLTNPTELFTSNANLIVLDNEKAVTFKEPPNVDSIYLPCKDFYTEAIDNDGELFCTVDIEAIFSMYEICVDYKDLFIWDSKGLNNSWAVLVGLSIYNNQSVPLRDTFNKCATNYPTIAPSSLWFIEVLDLALGLDGNLLTVAEEYLATKQIVTISGVANGLWTTNSSMTNKQSQDHTHN